MSIVLEGSTSGSVTLQEPAVAGTTVLDLPATSGTVLTSASQSIPKAALPTGSVLQVVQSVKTDTATFDLASGAVSGDVMTASITPTSSSSKIIVIFNGSVGNENTAGVYGYLYKNGSVVSGLTGNTAGSRQRVAVATRITEASSGQPLNFIYLDSPATTSSTTYSLRLGHASGENRFIYLNRSHTDTDANYGWRSASTIILMEIAA
jgi:hypothetical protein